MSDTPLFDLLDAVVRAEPKRPRLGGRIAVGVHGPLATEWWYADLRDTLDVQRTAERPEADAWLMTTGVEAARWARGEGLSEAPRVRMAGDRKLIERFVQGFLTRRNSVSVRTGGGDR